VKILDCERLKKDVWFDESESVTFNKNQFQNQNGIDFNFVSSDKRWLAENFSYILQMFDGIGSGETIFNEDYMWKKPKSFKKFENSTIMFWSGGPSSKKYIEDLKNKKISLPEDVDYNFAMNAFYKVFDDESILPKIDMAVINKDTDKTDQKLLKYIEKNNTAVVFEECKDSMIAETNISKLFPDRTSWYNTRYQSKTGIGTRFLLFSMMLGVKKIYFVGLDGFSKDLKELGHAFEEGKTFPMWNMNPSQVYHMIKRQFIIFWEYVQNELNNYFDCEFVNLAENYTEVSTFGKITKEWDDNINR